VIQRHGALVPVSLAADCLNMSKQRVHQIISTGRLVRVVVHGHSFISERSLVEFAAAPKSLGGRPQKKAA
jgi:hypothetical protein